MRWVLTQTPSPRCSCSTAMEWYVRARRVPSWRAVASNRFAGWIPPGCSRRGPDSSISGSGKRRRLGSTRVESWMEEMPLRLWSSLGSGPSSGVPVPCLWACAALPRPTEPGLGPVAAGESVPEATNGDLGPGGSCGEASVSASEPSDSEASSTDSSDSEGHGDEAADGGSALRSLPSSKPKSVSDRWASRYRLRSGRGPRHQRWITVATLMRLLCRSCGSWRLRNSQPRTRAWM
mmetsp:Transcript_117699/g.204928  ORF Transcript_117699/g.204928 Transcript_117699/m.204928 type:complete len:235 (+) Transcript_117699:1241-1945(+)